MFSNCGIKTINYCKIINRFSSTEVKKMRFVQFARKNDTRKHLGVVSEDGKSLTELSESTCICNDMIKFISQGFSMEEINLKLKSLKSEPINDNFTLLPPVTNPEKIIGIGLNYLDHCLEQNKEKPKEPMFFSKFASTLVGPTGNIIAHSISNKIDWEVELAVIIGKEARHVSKEEAMDFVFGYSVAQDISARDWQKERNGGQFLIGKSMDTFCPLGPSIVHKSTLNDPQNLWLSCKVNGETKQFGNTKDMIYKVDEIIHHLTKCITLKPGDVILTGTPAGVGQHRNPPEYLKPNDLIETEIQCLGKLYNKVIQET